MNHTSIRAGAAALGLLVCVSLSSLTLVAQPPKTLYERLGGQSGHNRGC